MLLGIVCIVAAVRISSSEAPFSIDFTCSNQKFDISSLECSACDNALSLSVSLDKSVCLSCDAATAIFNSTTNQCQCNSYNKYLSDLEDEKICTQCPTNYVVSSLTNHGDNYECKLCESPKIIDSGSNNQCICPSGFVETQSGEGCVNSTFITSDYSLSTSSQISFKNVDTSETVTVTNSALFEYYFLDSAVNCKIYNDIKSCQILGNLCVLTMYNKLHNSCLLFLEISDSISSVSNAFSNWKQNLPFLFYADHTILTSTALSSTLSVTLNDKLTIIFVKYSMNGTMIGYQEINDELFYFCKDSINTNDQEKFTKIGYNTDISCSFDLSTIFNANSNGTNYDDLIFYDIYLYISSQNKYYPLPIYVNNIDNNDGYKIVRRFFISDNFASNNQVLMFLQSVTFKVTIYSQNKIYPPLIQIKYGMIKLSDSSKTSSISFSGLYVTDLTNFQTSIIILFVITLILIICKWIYNVYRYQKMELINTINPSIAVNAQQQTMDLSWFIRIVFIGFGVSSHLFFWFLFFISSYCYLSFKGQSNIKFLLPEDDSSMMTAFKALLIYCFFAKVKISNIFYLYQK